MSSGSLNGMPRARRYSPYSGFERAAGPKLEGEWFMPGAGQLGAAGALAGLAYEGAVHVGMDGAPMIVGVFDDANAGVAVGVVGHFLLRWGLRSGECGGLSLEWAMGDRYD